MQKGAIWIKLLGEEGVFELVLPKTRTEETRTDKHRVEGRDFQEEQISCVNSLGSNKHGMLREVENISRLLCRANREGKAASTSQNDSRYVQSKMECFRAFKENEGRNFLYENTHIFIFSMNL